MELHNPSGLMAPSALQIVFKTSRCLRAPAALDGVSILTVLKTPNTPQTSMEGLDIGRDKKLNLESRTFGDGIFTEEDIAKFASGNERVETSLGTYLNVLSVPEREAEDDENNARGVKVVSYQCYFMKDYYKSSRQGRLNLFGRMIGDSKFREAKIRELMRL